MINKKYLYLANFNCTFGDKNCPMLEYFEEIIYPAFTSGVKRKPSKKMSISSIKLSYLSTVKENLHYQV